MGAYFFKLGRSLLTQRRRHDFPVRCKRPLDRMELQSLGPYFFTWFNNTSSSSAFHGPFLMPSSLFTSIFFSSHCQIPNISHKHFHFSKDFFCLRKQNIYIYIFLVLWKAFFTKYCVFFFFFGSETLFLSVCFPFYLWRLRQLFPLPSTK